MLRVESEAARSVGRPDLARGQVHPLRLPLVRSRSFARVSARVGLLVALFGVGSGCGDDEEPLGDLARISGTVRDQASDKGLKGVKIVFTSDTLETYEARTDEGGEYDITVEPRVPHGRIEASKSGYQPRSVSVFLDDNTVQIDVDLPRAD